MKYGIYLNNKIVKEPFELPKDYELEGRIIRHLNKMSESKLNLYGFYSVIDDVIPYYNSDKEELIVGKWNFNTTMQKFYRIIKVVSKESDDIDKLTSDFNSYMDSNILQKIDFLRLIRCKLAPGAQGELDLIIDHYDSIIKYYIDKKNELTYKNQKVEWDFNQFSIVESIESLMAMI